MIQGRDSEYDPSFDVTVGKTESPDVASAVEAVREAAEAAATTDSVIAENRRYMEQLRQIRENNHFTQKFRKILQGA